jgi:hypothetical protein
MTLDAAGAAELRQGGQPRPEICDGPVPALFRLLDGDGELVAVGRRDDGSGEPRTAAVFPVATAPVPDDGDRTPEDDPCG